MCVNPVGSGKCTLTLVQGDGLYDHSTQLSFLVKQTPPKHILLGLKNELWLYFNSFLKISQIVKLFPRFS